MENMILSGLMSKILYFNEFPLILMQLIRVLAYMGTANRYFPIAVNPRR